MNVAAGRAIRASGVPIEMYLDPEEAHRFNIASYGSDDAIGSPAFPLATLSEARTRMRSILPTMSRDAVVHIYDRPTDSAIALDDNDSGQNGYKAVWQGGDTLKSTVEGHIENGNRITGWTLFDAENNIWSADYNGPFCRSIWIDNVRCIRGRRGSGLTSPTWTTTGYTIPGDAILTETNAADVVLLYNDLDNNFNEPHNRVTGVDGNDITMIDPAHTYITVFPGLSRIGWTAGYATETMPVDVEGCWADFVAVAGRSFYYDREGDIIYCIPGAGEDLNAAVVLAPGVDEILLDIDGASDIDVARLGIYRAGFAMTEGFAERYGGVGYDSTHVPSDGGGGNYGPDGGNLTLMVFPAAIRRRNCTRVNLIDIRIKHHECLGLQSYGNTDCELKGPLFDDIGSTGMMTGDYTELESDTCTDGDLQENIIAARCGVMYRGGIGINDAIMTRSTLRKVLVYDCPYVGINLSYGHTWDESWDDKIEENVVRYLRLHDCMTILADGAAIGSSGNKRGLVIEYFYVSDIRDGDSSIPGLPRGGAMLDDTSTNQTVQFGVIDNCLHTIICNNPANPNTLVVTDIYADRDADLISTIPPNTYDITVTGTPTSGAGAAIVAVAKPDDYYLNIYAAELP